MYLRLANCFGFVRNLLSLKNYEGDVAKLELDFTVAHNELGEIEV